MRSDYAEIVDEGLKIKVTIPRGLLKDNVRCLDLARIRIEKVMT